MADADGRYAFPHGGADERRRLDLFAARLDPLTRRRIEGLGLARDACCLEVGGGRGSIARWLCQEVARAVLMPIADRMAALRRMASWLAPGGWLVAEEADFGMWLADFDPLWAAHPAAWHEAFPHGSLGQGRALLRQVHQLGLADIGADAELDIVKPGTELAEFYQLSIEVLAEPMISAGILTADDAARLAARPGELDFLGCGFAFIGVWGRNDSHA